jgi:hypothetical protein
MANYKEGFFVIPVGELDVTVKVKDKYGNIRHSINPLQVTVMFVKMNTINIRTKSSDNLILIDFDNEKAAKIGLIELRTEMDKIINRVNKVSKDKDDKFTQLESGVDFASLYQSGTVSATSSTPVKIEDRLTAFITQLRNDFQSLKNQEKITLTLNPINEFLESNNQHIDVLNYAFNGESDGSIDVYINSVYLSVGNSSTDIAFLSNDSGVTKSDKIENGSRLYINPFLLGYDLNENDSITITFLTKLTY